MKRLISLLVLSISTLMFSPHSGSAPSIPQENLLKYIPEDIKLDDWKRDGSPQEYRGEDLFEYIDGGAEIYHEYGFRQVIVQDYLSKTGKSISLEIFEMSSPESAYGIYTFKTSSQGEVLRVGDDALLEGYYMNFWKGNFLITLTGFDEETETVKGLKTIARAVDGKIMARGKKPHLVSMLPQKSLLPLSVKYFRGNLGLYNAYSFFTQDVFACREGIKANYKAGYSIYIIEYESIEECQKRFINVKKNFAESSRYNSFNPINDELFRVKDRKGRLILASLYKTVILVVTGVVSQDQAENIFGSIQKNIGRKRGQSLFF